LSKITIFGAANSNLSTSRLYARYILLFIFSLLPPEKCQKLAEVVFLYD